MVLMSEIVGNCRKLSLFFSIALLVTRLVCPILIDSNSPLAIQRSTVRRVTPKSSATSSSRSFLFSTFYLACGLFRCHSSNQFFTICSRFCPNSNFIFSCPSSNSFQQDRQAILLCPTGENLISVPSYSIIPAQRSQIITPPPLIVVTSPSPAQE